ncbi:multifunctional procollagen lysine hydroxylase and glycosyltransferase LH3-like [Trichomycterus rosablanca]|uniref:multifunctional procollagen lysine hydroxylase and glycosyltransferase LH3-like n=1 Tax=Trichomycterus rosablanca TaxID=2290929 RepID=UPI002F35C55A
MMMEFRFLVLCITVLLQSVPERARASPDELLVITAATEETDGFKRFMRTARQFNYMVKVFQGGRAPILNDKSEECQPTCSHLVQSIQVPRLVDLWVVCCPPWPRTDLLLQV